MGLFSIKGCRISGLSACVPSGVRYNAEYEWISPAERESLIKTTGVEQCRVAGAGTTSVDLAFASANQLINALGWKTSDIQLLVLVTQTGDYLMPASSNILQDRLGLPKDCMAIDINSGCSGYINGLAVASALVSSGKISKALLLTAEIPSRNTSPTDKSTFPLFGDAAAATALEYDAESAGLWFNIQSDGKGYDTIMIPDGGMRNPVNQAQSFAMLQSAPGIVRNRLHLALDGMKVFNFSLREVIPNIRSLLLAAGIEQQQIDYFVLHQANKLIIDSIRKKMGETPEKFPLSIKHFGNTSSASIPLTMVTEMRGKLTTQPHRLVLSGFGVGLSWGSCVQETDSLCIPELLEI
ncbi:MAG: ketoacyl-ACP synthase III [Bacteroidales bacterium]|nr:ketoacyl-ACP synthase III [Bacteroidales bacterium]